MKTHPYAEASYEVVPLDAGGFGVKVYVPESNPTTVSRFQTKAAAEAWIASHKSRIQAENRTGRFFRRTKPPAAG